MKPILSPELPRADDTTAARITDAWLCDEAEHVAMLLDECAPLESMASDIRHTALGLVQRVRDSADEQGVIEAFMREYDLSSEEGVLLMCVAEALLRVPDQDTADKLIRDKLGDADWGAHLGKSESMLVNASTWGLMLTGRMVNLADDTKRNVRGAFRRLVGRSGEPVIRLAVRQAMRIMGHQFVMGRSIAEALKRSRKGSNRHYRYSFDMLGEAAFTAKDAARYLEAYRRAIIAIGAGGPYPDIFTAPSISVKLSALHPRYEHAKRARVIAELTPRVLELAQLAKAQGIGFTVDAEEADRLELSLEVILGALADESLDGWNGYGLAVQAYMKRAPYVVDHVIATARALGRRVPMRLVKGAYWDSEVKKAQVDGLEGFSVFTRKPNTDLSYLACARRMLQARDALYPMFATHNAHSIAAIHHLSASLGAQGGYEYQRLHGMGEDLYSEVIGPNQLGAACRVYAPVGSHEDLLPYLVRRLLENGANTSFVNKISDEDLPPEALIADPLETVRGFDQAAHPRIALPGALFGIERKNSMGVNLANDHQLRDLAEKINAAVHEWRAEPLVASKHKPESEAIAVTNPADRREKVGEWFAASPAQVDQALADAKAAQAGWDRMPAAGRAKILEHAADLMESRMADYMALCTKEAGKSLSSGVAEVREAVDFLRYYAQQARALFAQPTNLPGPTGESNQLSLHGRGVFVCISPWNFPLAIFIGQIAAALVAGNTVLAKPAEQTTLTAYAAVKLLYEAGIPRDVLQLLPGDGASVGVRLTNDPRVAGVAFTGSTETAWAINRALAGRNAQIAVLIAETGGQNAMIADSSALPEQLVKDVIASSFDSAGQRCSAARVLFVQEDIADRVIEMLSGAMDELTVGDPGLLSTDVGPVIDEDARRGLLSHCQRMDREARLIRRVELGEACEHGCYVAPVAYELSALSQLDREQFGPILHVIRWKTSELDRVIDAINDTGYGLTLGIHSRIDDTVEHIVNRVHIGNCYVNRNQIGAVVGVQPFGGEGLSGTGPKAGGPHYLLRFAGERSLSINTTAAGGNASLLTLED